MFTRIFPLTNNPIALTAVSRSESKESKFSAPAIDDTPFIFHKGIPFLFDTDTLTFSLYIQPTQIPTSLTFRNIPLPYDSTKIEGTDIYTFRIRPQATHRGHGTITLDFTDFVIVSEPLYILPPDYGIESLVIEGTKLEWDYFTQVAPLSYRTEGRMVARYEAGDEDTITYINGRKMNLANPQIRQYLLLLGGHKGYSKGQAQRIINLLLCEKLCIENRPYIRDKSPELVSIDNYERVGIRCELTHYEAPQKEFSLIDRSRILMDENRDTLRV